MAISLTDGRLKKIDLVSHPVHVEGLVCISIHTHTHRVYVKTVELAL